MKVFILLDGENILSNGAMANTTIHSSPVNIQWATAAALQAIWSAGSNPVGTLSVEYSNDGTNWDTDSNSSVSVSGNTGHQTFILPVGPKFARLTYVGASGTGTLNVTANVQAYRPV